MSNTGRGIIELTGEDSIKFLQGQVSCDLHKLSGDKIIRGCHCTPKGRVIFLFSVKLGDNNSLLLETHPLIVETAIASLKKYAVFFKTKIEDKSQEPNCIEPEMNNLCRLRAGIADINPETSDLFIPQMLNLDLLDFISFKKGCYTGQEVVARAHYLGTVKRRMYLVAISHDLVPPSGQPLLDSNNKQVGTIINALRNEKNTVEALVVFSSPASNYNAVYLDGHITAVEPLNLPYALN